MLGYTLGQSAARSERETLFVSTLTCSTKLTQNGKNNYSYVVFEFFDKFLKLLKNQAKVTVPVHGLWPIFNKIEKGRIFHFYIFF